MDHSASLCAWRRPTRRRRRIDLDDLIDGEHRAGRRRRWLGAVGGTAAAVIAIAVGAAVIQGYGASPGGTPFGNPGPGTAQPNPTGKGTPGPEDPSVPTPTEPTGSLSPG